MHLAFFITTVTFLLAQFASLQSIALSSIGAYSAMPSSRPPTLPASSTSPGVNGHTSTHKLKGEIVTQIRHPRPALNPAPTSPAPSAGPSEPRALSISIVYPLSDMRTNLDASIPSTDSTNAPSSRLSVSPRSTNFGGHRNIEGTRSSPSRKTHQSSNTRRKRKAKDEEELRQANFYPAQDQNVGPSSGSYNVDSAMSDTLIHITQRAGVTNTPQQQWSRVHNTEASPKSTTFNTAASKQQPDNPFLIGDRTTDGDGPSNSPLYNNHHPSTNQTSLSPSYTAVDMVDNRQPPTPQNYSRSLHQWEQNEPLRRGHEVIRKGAGAMISSKPNAATLKNTTHNGASAAMDIDARRLYPDTSEGSISKNVKGKGKAIETPNALSTRSMSPAPSSPPKHPAIQRLLNKTGLPKGLSFRKNKSTAASSASIPIHHSESSSRSPSTSTSHASCSGYNSTSHPSSQDYTLSKVTKASPSLPPVSLPHIFASHGSNVITVNMMRASTPAPEDPMVQDSEKIEQPTAVVLDVVTSLSNDIVSDQPEEQRTLNTVDGTSKSDDDEWDLIASLKTPVEDVKDEETPKRGETPSGSSAITISHDTYAGEVSPAIPSPCRCHHPSSSGSPQSSSSQAQPRSPPSELTTGDAADSSTALPSSNVDAKIATSPNQTSNIDFLYEEEMQSVGRPQPPAVHSAPPRDLPAVAAAILAQELSLLVPDEPIGTRLQENRGASHVPSLANPNVASNRVWLDLDVSNLPPLPPSPAENTTFAPLSIADASMVDASYFYEGHVLVPVESTGTVGMQDMEVEPPILLGIVDVPMATLDDDDDEMAVEDPVDALSIGVEGIVLPKDPVRDESPDTEMGSEEDDAEDNDAHMTIEEIVPSAFADESVSLLLGFAAQQRGNISTAGPTVPISQQAVKGTGPPQRAQKVKAAPVTVKILPGVGFVPVYPSGEAFRLESSFGWPMDTTPDREFSRWGECSTDESMDWTSTDSSDTDIEMEDLTCPPPTLPHANVFVSPLTKPTLEERHTTQGPVLPQPLIVLPAVSLTISIAPHPELPPAQVQASIDKPVGLAPAIPVEESKDTPASNPKTGEEAPTAAEPSAEVPEPKPREVHAPPPDVRTSGGGLYASLVGGNGQHHRRQAEQWYQLTRMTYRPTTASRLRGGKPDCSPSTPDEIRAHLNPGSNRITPPPRATPQPAAADPIPSPVPSQVPGHAALITTVQPVAPGRKYTRECHFPVPLAASHSAVTTPLERTAARPLLHRRLSSAATIERAAARGLVPHIPEENDQERHSPVIDANLGKKVKKSGARKSRKEGERRSKKKQVAALPEVLVSAPPVDPLTHAARWGVEENSLVGSLYAEVSAGHDWLSQNPWYLIEWYLVMLALVFALGNRFFVTALLMSLCIDPWLVHLRHGIFIPASTGSVSLVTSTVANIRNAVTRIRRSIGNLPIIGRLIR